MLVAGEVLEWLGLALALGIPGALAAARGRGVLAESPALQGYAMLFGLWATAAATAALLFLDHRVLADFGLAVPSGATILWGLGTGVAGILAFPLCALTLRLLGAGEPDNASARFLQLSLSTRLLILVTAAVTEEWLYRGFAITTLQKLTGSLAVGASLPLLVFIVLHSPWYSRSHLFYVSFAGVLMTGLFLIQGDLWANFLAHAVIDAVPLLVLPAAARRSKGDPPNPS